MAITREQQDDSSCYPTDSTSLTDNTSGPTRDVRILLVEDSPVNRKIILHILERKLGYGADSVANGAEALEVLQSQRYDLILMDCHMPIMDGYQATAAIRNLNSDVLDHTVRIVAISANTMQGEREKCLAAGMDDYITKPMMPGELAGVLDRNLPDGGTADVIMHPCDSEWEDDPELARILNDFVESLPSKIVAMRRALDNNCFDEVRRTAHQLKGTGGGYGYPALTESARGLENAAGAGCRETALLALIQLNTLCQAVTAGHRAAATAREAKS